MTLTEAIENVERHLLVANAQAETLRTVKAEHESEVLILTEVDLALRALLQTKTKQTLGEAEQLILRGLQTVFGPEWVGVSLDAGLRQGRLSATLKLRNVDGSEGNPVDTYGGGPASLVAFILRMLVVRRMGLAPLLLLDESFSMVSADYVERVSTFLRLLVDKLGVTVLLVTHQPEFKHAATRVYRASLVNGRTVFEEGC